MWGLPKTNKKAFADSKDKTAHLNTIIYIVSFSQIYLLSLLELPWVIMVDKDEG